MKTRIHTLSFLAVLAAFALGGCTKKEAPVPAAAPAVQTPVEAKPKNVAAFKIGEFEALALRDGGMELPNDNKVFGVGRTPEEVAAVLAGAGQPGDTLRLTIQPLLVKANDRVMLFDTGAGGNFGPDSGHLSVAFAEAGIDPASVTDVFISHGHGDHIGGLVKADGTPGFPNARIHLSAPEWKFITGLTTEQANSMGLGNHAALVAAIKPKVAGFAPGAELVPGIVKAVEVKGHTPGHSAYLISSGSDSLLFVGDSMHHFVVSVQKPEWTIAFDGDSATAQASRAALIAESAANGQRIYAVHFPFPGIGRFETRGESAVWVAE